MRDKAKDIIVMAIEQMGREYNWEGTVKHSKAVEKITTQTGLNSGEIFDIIKSVIGKMNENKDIDKNLEGQDKTKKEQKLSN